MSWFRQKSSAATKPDYTGLQLQTSVSTLPVPIIWGQTKVSANVVWYSNFQTHSQQSSSGGGKGGLFSSGGGLTSYTYTADLILALCEGPIAGIGTVWKDQSTYSLADLGLSFFNGATPQSVWGYLASADSSQALAYQGTAFVCAASYQLGDDANIGNHNFEIIGILAGSGVDGIDADPAQVIYDFLTNAQYGAGFNPASIDTTTLFGSGGDASLQTYCKALGIAFSPCLTDQEQGSSVLARWLQLTNCAAVWSGGKLKFIPYGDSAIGGNGTSYVPNLTPIYNLTDFDFVDEKGNKDPVQVSRVDPFALPTIQRVECLSRSNEYGAVPVEARDQSQIELYGPRVGTTIQGHEICDEINVGPVVAQTILQRLLYVRANFTFKLSWEYCLLDPADVVEISDANLGLSSYPVRIVSIEEDDSGLLTVVAEELPVAISTPVLYPNSGSSGFQPNQGIGADPVNTPLIWEAPTALTNGAAELWLGASGGASGVGDPNWGGAFVWMSFDDATYSQIAVIQQPLRQGLSTAALAAASGWDATDALVVNLAESGGVLSGATATAAQSGGTLALIDGELLAYESATLTGANAYRLTGLERGLYGTLGAAHASGAPFARLDGAVLKYAIPSSWIGRTVWLKFQSYNVWGAGLQEISACVAYSHVVLGSGVYVPADVAGLGGALTLDGATYTLAAQWTADPNSATYQAQYSLDGATWDDVYSGSAPAFSVRGFGYVALLYLRVRGVNGGFASPTWTQITIAAGPQQVVPVANAGLYVQFDDLSGNLLDALHLSALVDNDEQLGATLSGALAAQSETNTVAASVNSLSATVTSNWNAQVSANESLANSIEQVAAQTAAGTANGSIQFVADSSLQTGISAAFQLQISAAGAGGTFVYAGMRAEVKSDGTSQMVFEATQTLIENGATKTVVFAANSDGSLTLQGVTKIASTLVSLGSGVNGQPYMTQNFGSSPYIVVDDGT